ncbi:MAG: hypothetical protein CVV58_06110 [Tenericutes bacterium HGW-Tenericutes-3]|nr:MAG: hypothetical protein CVV58_06110 [Tenericutes bacterium HGW-Tenericutes-3]
MAYYNEDQLYRYFDKAIQRESKQKIEALQKEFDYLYAKEMKKITEDLTMKKNLELNKALKELQLEYQDKINKIGVGYDEKLIKERTFMTNIVFHSVLDKIYQFITSKKYEDLMKEKLEKVNQIAKEKHIQFTISDRDTHLPGLIKEVIKGKSDIILSPNLHLGGFEATIEKDGIVIDETIDSKLAEQKEWFYKNSKLFIRK